MAKEVVHTMLTAAKTEYAELERTVVAVCQELEGEGALSGSSVASRLRSLGGRVAEHIKSTFRLDIQRPSSWPRPTMIWTSRGCHRGTSFASAIGVDAASAAMDDADAAVEARKLKDDIPPPIAEFDTVEDP